ncbi:MAG: molybdate ABC transporter substrate-binding protein [Cephaloticoccus sp.]
MPLRLLFLLGCLLPALRGAEPLRVAAAANLSTVMPELVAAFSAEAPDVRVETSFGASGSLVAQIRHGAPYAVFLSADLDYPRALVAAGEAEARSLITFARGRLAFWAPAPADGDLTAQLRASRKIAIANPAIAPYGRAAEQTLTKLGMLPEMRSRLVIGENIGQTAQFVDSGNADAGFVALSVLLTGNRATRGRHWVIEESWHEPLAQGAVITRRGLGQPAAAQFLAFLASDAARKVFARHGYAVPASP